MDLSIDNNCIVRPNSNDKTPHEVETVLFARNNAKMVSHVWQSTKVWTSAMAWMNLFKVKDDHQRVIEMMTISGTECKM